MLRNFLRSAKIKKYELYEIKITFENFCEYSSCDKNA